MGRELDEQVAEALGLDVIGWEPARPDPEAPTWYVWQWAEEKHPVYLAHCVCDLVDELDDDEILDCGHYAGCLEVVPFYSSDIAAVSELRGKVTDDMRPAFINSLCDQMGIDKELLFYDGRDWASYDALWMLVTATPEQWCRAFLAAKEVGDDRE